MGVPRQDWHDWAAGSSGRKNKTRLRAMSGRRRGVRMCGRGQGAQIIDRVVGMAGQDGWRQPLALL